MAASSWCTIESDPGVFTELLERLGVKDVEVAELFTLEEESFAELEPCYGLMFLFKWTEETTNNRHTQHQQHTSSPQPPPANLFYAKQLVTNACGTQALLSCLLNAETECGVDIGPELRMFKDFVKDFDSELRGMTLGENELIREQHNAFARPEPFQLDDGAGNGTGNTQQQQRRLLDEDEDDQSAYHFIAYVPFQNAVYELDGLNPAGPVLLDSQVPFAEWLACAKRHVEARIARYQEGELHFNLMALVRDRRLVGDAAVVAQEEEKRRQWSAENARRKHNYVPFILASMRLLAERKELGPLLVQAKEKQKQQQQQQKKQPRN